MQNTGPRPSLHKEIAETLTEKIISGELPAHALLPPERVLIQQMGVSRTVVREAIKLLESRGLVRVERGRGTVVQEPRPDTVTDSLRLLLRRRDVKIEQLLELRAILESGIAGLAAERRTEADLGAMRQALDIMSHVPHKPEGYIYADLDFHAAIARAAQNPLLSPLLQPLEELLLESRVATFSGSHMVKVRTAQHREIYEKIAARDARGARAAMRRHLADTVKDLEHHQRTCKGQK
jgi:GntR family transcriptional repressor for pyruvate dehydrogenase complex